MIAITLTDKEASLVRVLLARRIREDVTYGVENPNTDNARGLLERIREAELAR